MKIKERPKAKRKPKFIYGVEVELERGYARLPQLNKFYRNRRNHG